MSGRKQDSIWLLYDRIVQIGKLRYYCTNITHIHVLVSLYIRIYGKHNNTYLNFEKNRKPDLNQKNQKNRFKSNKSDFFDFFLKIKKITNPGINPF